MEGAGHHKMVGQVAFSPSAKRLASPGGEGQVRIWDLHTKHFRGDRKVGQEPEARCLTEAGAKG
jgi:hypothetical protein